jgi:hypothetical protein
MDVETNNESVEIRSAAERVVMLIPKIVKPLTPSNGAEQKQAFLEGSEDQPDHQYENQLSEEEIESVLTEIDSLRTTIIADENFGIHKQAYLDVLEEARQKYQLLDSARKIKESAGTDIEAIGVYSRANVEVYGEPDVQAYESMVTDLKVRAFESQGQSSAYAKVIAEELKSLLPDIPPLTNGSFVPSEETISWVKDVVETLYENLFRHVDETRTAYDGAEIADLFTQIITQEFAEAASDWKVELRDDKSAIEVERLARVIYIPSSKNNVSIDKVKGLIAHELGIHFMRSLMGEDTDVDLLRVGLAQYTDAEEGFGVVLEQALKAEFKPAGEDLFLAASLAHFEGMNFRQVYEIMWRKAIVDNAEAPDNSKVDRLKASSYAKVQRIFRGTDYAPLLKDTSYFVGSQKIWKHLESIRGNDTFLTLMFMGKTDPTNEQHKHTLLDSRSI